jgi:hypothetical protein
LLELGNILDFTADGRLVLETAQPWTEVQQKIESKTNRRVVLTGK